MIRRRSKSWRRFRNALLISTGYRGDTEPLISLGLSLLNTQRFDFVHVCIQPEYEELIPYNPRLVSHVLPFSASRVIQVLYWEYYKESILSFFTGRMDPIRPQMRGLSNVMKNLILPSLPHLHSIAVAVQPQIIISTAIYSAAALTLAEHLFIPMVLVNFQPLTATGKYPFIMTDLTTAEAAAEILVQYHNTGVTPDETIDNVKTYDRGFRQLATSSMMALNAFRSRLALRAYSEVDIGRIFRGDVLNLTILNAYPAELIPHCPQWAHNIYTVQPLVDEYVPIGWHPEQSCPRLAEYLEDSEKPFCVSFGSVHLNDRKKHVTTELFKGLRACGLKRILIVNGFTDLGEHNLGKEDEELKTWSQQHVYVCDEKPYYPWLLPQCTALLCHGGAGTIFSALRAGLPLVIAPMAVDQFFWAKLVEGMGLGSIVQPNLRNAVAESYSRSITEAMDSKVREKSVELSSRMRARGEGAKKAANLIASLVP